MYLIYYICDEYYPHYFLIDIETSVSTYYILILTRLHLQKKYILTRLQFVVFIGVHI
jgi:hypothetical protein